MSDQLPGLAWDLGSRGFQYLPLCGKTLKSYQITSALPRLLLALTGSWDMGPMAWYACYWRLLVRRHLFTAHLGNVSPVMYYLIRHFSYVQHQKFDVDSKEALHGCLLSTSGHRQS